MGKEIKGITAKEARELADSSDYTLKHIYKYIRERASENAVLLEWCSSGLSDAAVETIVSDLNGAGFKVKADKGILKISW